MYQEKSEVCNMIPLKDRLRFLREEKELSQLQIADILGFKPGTYSSYENGVTPKTDVLVRIAQYHGVTMDYLLGISNERKPEGGRLAPMYAELARLASEDAPSTNSLVMMLDAAIKYYRNGAPCGEIPMKAFNGFVDGLRDALIAATAVDTAAVLAGANAASVAALEVANMPSALIESQKRGDTQL